MNRPEIYQKSINILLDAYNEGKLEHGSTCGCAIGNLVAGNLNYNIKKVKGGFIYEHSPEEYYQPWAEVFCTVQEFNWNDEIREEEEIAKQEFDIKEYLGEAKKQIDATGYTPKEAARIEFAFESAVIGKDVKNNKEGQFLGLTAVLDVLKDIHSTEIEESTKNQEKLENIYQDKLQTA